jgi:predicted ribosome quality control (RQC) complex YloA/Tae2 family protein
MYLSELIPVVKDLQGLVGSPLTGVWQPKRDRLVIGLAGGLLSLVPRGPYARLGKARNRPKNPQKPFSFQGACRKHLRGRLESLEVLGGDREVHMGFSGGSLRLRLTGRGGGLWLLTDGKVVAAYDGPAGELPELPTATPTTRTPRFTSEALEWATSAEQYFGRLEGTERTRSQHQGWMRGLRDEHKRLTRLEKNLNADVESGSKVERKRRQADALAAALYTVAPGAQSVTVTDLEFPDVVHTLHLDTAMTPGDNLSRLYERLKRTGARTAAASERLGRATLQRQQVEMALAELEDGKSELAVQLVRDAPKRRQAPAGGEGIEYWSGPEGQQLWVGKNALNNRKLTFQKARGRDWWMHVRGRPGAHVVLPVRSGKPPNLQWLLAGAQLAAWKSKIGVGDAVDVQYTQIKNVRAIPGDAHGRVTVHSESVLHVVRNQQMPDGWQQDDL